MAERDPAADWKAFHGILFFALITGTTFVPFFRTWPLIWIAPLAGYFLFVALTAPLRKTFCPWSFGQTDHLTLLATGGIMAVSCATLFLFQKFAHPDLGPYAAIFPKLPGSMLVLAGALFVVVNALCEEVIFRGIFFNAIKSQAGTIGAVLGTSILFGLGHMHGYPPGPLGALLAGVYGLALSWLRAATGVLGLPVIAHLTADATIFVIVMNSGAL